MFRKLSKLMLACLPSCPLGAAVQIALSAESSEESRWAMLPTDRALRADSGMDSTVPMSAFLDGPVSTQNSETPPLDRQDPPLDLKGLLRPRVDFFAEWEPESDGLAVSSYDLSAKMPLYPIFGPPPPLISAGYSFTQIAAPVVLDLPDSLHDFSLGLAWMRRINDR